ncbi:MAG: GNAT family N-acetyltransferase [Lachnospiraceae bacterium]|jgi:diamine N-acetyltransferase|nr:GNAT family N-acetyltransferase [Lachnospiraceae bacterium]
MGNVYLRQLAVSDRNDMLEWMKDPSVNQWFQFDTGKATIESVTKFITENREPKASPRNVHYAICAESDEYCGTVSLKNIDYASKNADFAIALRSKMQGQEIGYLATKAILRYAFQDLHLHKVYLNVLSHNQKAIRFYEKIGFVYEGESIDHVYKNGEYYSLKWYRMLERDYKERME